MLKKRLMRKIMIMPFKKVGKSLANILVFDIAISIYQYAKTWLYRTEKTKEEEIAGDDFLTNLKDRRMR